MNIKYVIYKNEMPASSTEAKYLGKVIPNGVRNRAQMTENALRSEHVAQATFDSVLNTAVDITKELCSLGKDVDWGPMKFITKMHGSLPCEDSAFADGTASLTVDADGTNATRAVLDGLVPVKASAAEIDSLIKVSNVMDVGTEAFGVIDGTNQFAILGNGITLDGEGEYAKVLDRKTFEVKSTATVVSVSKGQRAYCKLPSAITAGDYTLEVATKGLLGETSPRVFRKPVTVLAAATPPPTVTKVTGDGDIGLMKACPYYAYGTNLEFNASRGDSITAKWMEGGVEKTLEVAPTAVTPTKMTFPATDAWNNVDAGTKVNFTFKLGTTTLTVETEVAGA